MKSILHTLILLSLFYDTNAQTPEWKRDASHSLAAKTEVAEAVVDSSGNTYVLLQFGYGSGYSNYSAILKYDPSGNITDTIPLDSMHAAIPFRHQLIYDGAGYLYAYGFDDFAANQSIYKVSTAGVKQWKYKTSSLYGIHDMTRDASGNIYICGASGSTNFPARVEKINSSGTRLWGTDFILSMPNGFNEFYAVKVDGSGNVYATGYGIKNSTEQRNMILVKFNSSGVKQWNIEFNGNANADDFGEDLAIDNSGNIYVTGQGVFDTSSIDYVTIKYNSSGVQQWMKQYNNHGNSIDYAWKILIDSNGDIIVGGTAQDVCYSTPGIIKYNSSGSKLWEYVPFSNCRSYGLETLVIDAAGNIYFSGTTNDSLNLQSTVETLHKLNSAGVLQWKRQVNNDSLNNDNASALTLDNAGNPVLSGSFVRVTAITYKTIASIVKFSSAGAQLWSNTHRAAFAAPDNHATLLADKNGNSYTIGNAEDVNLRIYIDKRDKNGNLVWRVFKTAVYSGTYANAATIDAQGNIYVCGKTTDDNTGQPLMLAVKYNTNGTELWSATYQSSQNSPHEAFDIAVDANNNVYFTGTGYKDFFQKENIFTLKYNSSGVQQWVAEYNGQNKLDKGIALDVDLSGNVFVTGIRTDSTNTTNWITIKYNSAGTQQWAVQSGVFSSNDTPKDIKADNAGGCYVIGKNTVSFNSTFTTIRFNSAGNVAWSKYVGNSWNGCNTYTAMPIKIEKDNAGNIYVVGARFYCGGSGNNLWGVICQKYNSNGDSLWAFSRNGDNLFYLFTDYDVKYNLSALDTIKGALYFSNLVYVTGQPVNVYKNEIIKINTSNGALQWVYADSILGTATYGVTLPFNSLAYDGVAALYSCYDVINSKTFTDSRTIKFCEPPVATATANGLTTFCQGDSVMLVTNAANVGSYIWSNGANTSSINVTTSGNYNCIITYTDGCTYATNSISATVKVIPSQPSIIYGLTNVCEGDTLICNIDSVSGALTYNWTVPSGWNIISGQGTLLIHVISSVSSGDITVSAANSCGTGTPQTLSVTSGLCSINLSVHLFIEGFYIGNEAMTPVLYNNSLSDSSSAVDSVTLELHDHLNPSTIIHTSEGILNASGDIQLTIPYAYYGGTYYLAILHRNSITTWSKLAVTLGMNTNYDFRD